MAPRFVVRNQGRWAENRITCPWSWFDLIESYSFVTLQRTSVEKKWNRVSLTTPRLLFFFSSHFAPLITRHLLYGFDWFRAADVFSLQQDTTLRIGR